MQTEKRLEERSSTPQYTAEKFLVIRWWVISLEFGSGEGADGAASGRYWRRDLQPRGAFIACSGLACFPEEVSEMAK